MFRSVRLSQQCSSSGILLIIYRRARRKCLDELGRIMYFLFGYRMDISLPSILSVAGKTEEDIPPVTLELLRSISTCWNEDPNLTLSGRMLLKSYYSEMLQIRSRISEVVQTTPEVQRIPINKPLFIIGWPRVGSTFMHKLLSCDPSNKCPPLWQLVNPVPEAWKTDIPSSASQIRDTQLSMDYYFDLEPKLYMLHEMNATDADECCHLFEQSWVDRHSPIISENMEQYMELLSSLSVEQQVEFYEFYKVTLQVMAYLNKDTPVSHHVLKDATHYLFMEAILKVFPDACIVMLHRKPAPVAKSCLSGIAFVARYYYRACDINYSNIAQRTLEWMRISLERGNEVRRKYEQVRPEVFYDINFEDFTKNPIETVKKMYAHFGYEYSSEFEGNMHEFLKEYEKFRSSKAPFRHSIEPFGQSEESINRMFNHEIGV